MLQLISVSPGDTATLQFIERIYIQSFPPDERRDFREVEKLLEQNACFNIVSLAHENSPVGFISYWQWEEFAYIEHFAIDSALRGGGYGAEGITRLLNQLGIPVVLEVELPENELSRRRIRFYERAGFTLCPLPYTQPAYSPDKQSMQLLLMSFGEMNLDHNFDAVVTRLHSQVYGVSI